MSAPAREASWLEWVGTELEAIVARGQWRSVRDLDALGPVGSLPGDAGRVVSFASNDYLGLTAHPAVIAAAHAALDRWGAGAGAARLVVGSRPIHTELEHELARWKAAPSALLFATGYAANLGVLSTLGGPGSLIISDELNHASIVDGCRLARGDAAISRHADVDHVASLIDGAEGRRVLVVTDAVFSMDGDVAPLEALCALCADRGAALVIDEAHSVLGPEVPETRAEVVRVGTMSKTLGALGGFVTGSTGVIDLLRNRARTFIFTTAATPADAAAALAAVQLLQTSDGLALVQRLRQLVDQVRPGHPSPIIPVVLGPEHLAVEAASGLLDRGLLVPAIRPPTVAPGSSRLRITLSAAHTDEHVDALLAALDELGLLAAARGEAGVAS